MLRTKWRELETEPRTRLDGHAGANPGYSQANVLTGHRASSRPYILVRTDCIRSPREAARPLFGVAIQCQRFREAKLR